MIFDTWGGALADGAYQRFSLDYISEGRRGPEARARRRARAGHHVHQGRRAVAGRNRVDRRGRGRTRLDRQPRRGAGQGRRSRGAAGQYRSERAVRAARRDPHRKRAPCSTASATSRAMSSISATAFRSSRRRNTSPNSSTKCIPQPRDPSEGQRLRRRLLQCSRRARNGRAFVQRRACPERRPFGGLPIVKSLTYAHFLRCGAPSYVWPESADKAGLCAKQPHDSKEKYLNRPAMWASAQSDSARGFCELSTKVLNKVIHRPVESLHFLKNNPELSADCDVSL